MSGLGHCLGPVGREVGLWAGICDCRGELGGVGAESECLSAVAGCADGV